MHGMKKKKTEKANLEKKVGFHLLIGIAISLSLILISFEWASTPSSINDNEIAQSIQFEDEMMQITRREEPKPEPKPEQPPVAEVLDIVDDDIVIDDEFDFDMEVDNNTEYDFIITEDDVEVIIEEDTPFIIVSQMPKFQGGDLTTFWKYCQDHTIYPEIAAENGVSGTVTVQFVVNKQGYVVNAVILRSVDPALDKEALRVINSSPQWEPGNNRGMPASVMMNLPIKFILQ